MVAEGGMGNKAKPSKQKLTRRWLQHCQQLCQWVRQKDLEVGRVEEKERGWNRVIIRSPPPVPLAPEKGLLPMETTETVETLAEITGPTH